MSLRILGSPLWPELDPHRHQGSVKSGAQEITNNGKVNCVRCDSSPGAGWEAQSGVKGQWPPPSRQRQDGTAGLDWAGAEDAAFHSWTVINLMVLLKCLY